MGYTFDHSIVICIRTYMYLVDMHSRTNQSIICVFGLKYEDLIVKLLKAYA